MRFAQSMPFIYAQVLRYKCKLMRLFRVFQQAAKLAAVSLIKDEIGSEIDAITPRAYVLFYTYLGLGSNSSE